MIPVRLVVSDKKGELAVFRRDRTRVELEHASGDVRADLERWMDRGLIELVGPRRDQQQRVTEAGEPEFLERVAARLQRYGFTTRFEAIPQVGNEEFAPVFTFPAMPVAAGPLRAVPGRVVSSEYTASVRVAAA
jgi:hypothetical protein